MSKALEAMGKLNESVQAAADLTSDALATAIAQGQPYDQAWEALREEWAFLPSTTVLESISRSPATVHTSDTAVVAAAHEPGARTPWRWTSAHGVQVAAGAPRGVKPLGRRAGRRKARGAGGESLARSAARKAYAAMHNAP